MSYPEHEWRVIKAGEYVLGTLQNAELHEFMESLDSDEDLKKLVVEWQETLQPLADETISIEPPPEVWGRIVDEISDNVSPFPSSRDFRESTNSGVTRHSKQLQRWRTATAFASAAAVAALSLLWFQQLAKPPSFDSISIVSAENSNPLWVVNASVQSGTLKIVAIAPPEIESNQVHELWMVRPDDGGVVSLGLLPRDGNTSIEIDSSMIDANVAALAVSVEPVGGSPEPAPTGPVLYQGEFSLIKATDL